MLRQPGRTGVPQENRVGFPHAGKQGGAAWPRWSRSILPPGRVRFLQGFSASVTIAGQKAFTAAEPTRYSEPRDQESIVRKDMQ